MLCDMKKNDDEIRDLTYKPNSLPDTMLNVYVYTYLILAEIGRTEAC